ncbi:PKD domain-containing protein [Galbitalea soli]|uniref:PKD domain-containing protein n=1 Tax=Galbitalea soli TaxID=1268042 RepID=A0A7C9PMU0_9MICO|nr:PKD domain-containing protein [Galbitalea soli]NEM91214.1 PKD domain-containing protein [Galbitalea soli]NYJ29903.1 PKD repeat protein [Galbitalea soli]
MPTVQIDGVVWSEVIIGNTVYAGGEFTTARPAGSPLGVNTVPRSNLLAFDLTTGNLITTFAPTVNGAVRTLAASPDGTRLYVGGLFTQINGVNRYRIAAFNVSTGTLVSGFVPKPNYRVNAIVATNDTVYFGGSFGALGSITRYNLAAVAASNAAVLPWAPVAAGGAVATMALSPDGSKLAIGGQFTTFDGGSNPGYGLGMVSATGDGSVALPFVVNSLIRDGGANAGIQSLVSDGDSLYGSGFVFGSGGNMEGSFRASWVDGSLIWIEDCHGDTYSVYPGNGLEYVAGHPHTCATIGGFPEVNPRVNHRALAFTKYVDGTVSRNTANGYYNYQGKPKPDLVNFFPTINAGTYTGQQQGPWFVTGNSQYVVYGGEFTAVNETAQQGLVRFAVSSIAPNKDGPQLSDTAFPVTANSFSSSSVKLSWTTNWDRDNEVLGYKVFRSGTVAPIATLTKNSRFYQLSTMTFTDTGRTPGTAYTYTVQASDPFGNVATSAPVTVTTQGTAPTNQLPTASFTASTSDLTASVDGSGSTDPDGWITNWAWDFGDGTTASGATASHSYAASGTYPVALTVTDNSGGTNTVTQQVTVTAAATASDAFGRTVTGGWGAADVGGSYTLSGTASYFAVGNGVGSVTLPKAVGYMTQKLTQYSATNTDATVTASLGAPVAGGNAYVSLIARTVSTSEYLARVVVAPTTNAITLQLLSPAGTIAGKASGLSYVTGQKLHIRVQAVGTAPTTLRARVWVDGTPEPTTWLVTATDSTAALQGPGAVGVGVYLGSTTTGFPQTISFDDLAVGPAN